MFFDIDVGGELALKDSIWLLDDSHICDSGSLRLHILEALETIRLYTSFWQTLVALTTIKNHCGAHNSFFSLFLSA